MKMGCMEREMFQSDKVARFRDYQDRVEIVKSSSVVLIQEIIPAMTSLAATNLQTAAIIASNLNSIRFCFESLNKGGSLSSTIEIVDCLERINNRFLEQQTEAIRSLRAIDEKDIGERTAHRHVP
jgi:ATP-dependent protease ClpP protease subunit